MNTQNAQLFAFVSIITGCVVTVFWMVVGWRAMRAHEKIAASLADDVDQRGHLLRAAARNDKGGAEPGRSFRDFLDADPIAKHLDSNEQMRRFVQWKNQ